MPRGPKKPGVRIGPGAYRGGWVTITKTSAKHHTGTETTQRTRNFANAPTTRIPSRVKLSLHYQSDDGNWKMRTMTVANPRVRRGARYDAGHKYGKQYGGSGSDPGNIFPQHPVVNRYPGRGVPYTLGQNWVPKKRVDSWRRMEDKIKRKVVKYGQVRVRYQVTGYHR